MVGPASLVSLMSKALTNSNSSNQVQYISVNVEITKFPFLSLLLKGNKENQVQYISDRRSPTRFY
jgi:hypothetical protein